MIELKNVSYTYSVGSPYETEALKNVTLTVDDGDFVGIIGHTGSGKSTLLNIISGLVKPSGGSVIINGTDITKEKAPAKALSGKVGIVFQYPEYQLFEETVYKDIAFGPKNLGLSKEETDERVKMAAEMTDISSSLFEKSPFELSGGQKRRVAIAGILAMRPEILILDEPAAGLDPVGKREITGQIKKMHEELNMTVILVSHSMDDVASLCDKAIVMSDGEIVRYGTVGDVFSHSEELTKIGLSVPGVTKVMLGLKKEGLPVRSDIFSMDDAVRELTRLFGGDGK